MMAPTWSLQMVLITPMAMQNPDKTPERMNSSQTGPLVGVCCRAEMKLVKIFSGCLVIMYAKARHTPTW
jgi:hypothetical protein